MQDAVTLTRAIRPGRSADVLESTVLDELVLYAPHSNEGFSLNASGRAIWALCDGRRTIDEIHLELCGQLQSPGPELLADLLAAILRFHECGLVELSSARFP